MLPAVPTAAILPETLEPYLIMMVAGFVIGAWGHGMKSRVVVAIGILLIFIATALAPLALVILEEDPEPPGNKVPEISLAGPLGS